MNNYGYGQQPMHGSEQNLQANVSPQGFAPVVQQPGSVQSMQQMIPMQPMQQMQSNTTVVIQQQTQPSNMPRPWSTGLCGCFEDFEVCLCVMFCGECYSYTFMGEVNEPCCLPFCFPMCWMGAVRTKIRTKYNIQGSILEDFNYTAGCCSGCTRPCVYCQMIREVKMMRLQGQPL